MNIRFSLLNNETDPKITFRSVPIKKTISYALTGEAYHKISSIKDVCNEIFGNIQKNSSLISLVNESKKNVVLALKSLKIDLSDSESVEIDLVEKESYEYYRIRREKDNKILNSAILNNNMQLVEYLENDNGKLETPNELNKNVAVFADYLYDKVDPELFDIRMNIRKALKNLVASVAVTSFTTNAVLTDNENSEQKKEKTKLELPSSIGGYNSAVASYSYKELQDQNLLSQNNKNRIVKTKKLFMPLELFKKKFPEKIKDIVIKSEQEEDLSALKPKASIELDEDIDNIEDIELEAKPLDNIYLSDLVEIKTKKNQEVGKIKRKPREKSIKNNNSNKIKTEKVKKVKKVKQEPVIPGNISEELSEKISEIQVLHSDFLKRLSGYSDPTIRRIKDNYSGLSTSINRITFADKYEVVMPKRKGYEKYKILNLKNLETGNEINFLDCQKVLRRQVDWNKITYLPILQLLSEEEINSRLDEATLNDVDNILNELKNLKKYLDKSAWRERKFFKVYHKAGEEIIPDGKLSNSTMKLILDILNLYNLINKTYSNLYKDTASEIRKKYNDVVLAKGSPRIEFVNLLGDSSNVLFHHVKTKHGECYKFIRHTGADDLEEVFLVTPDGRVISNPYSYRGLKYISNTMSRPDQTYYTEKDFEQNNVESALLRLAEPYYEKLIDYALYLRGCMEKRKGICYLPEKQDILNLIKKDDI